MVFVQSKALTFHGRPDGNSPIFSLSRKKDNTLKFVRSIVDELSKKSGISRKPTVGINICETKGSVLFG